MGRLRLAQRARAHLGDVVQLGDINHHLRLAYAQ